MGGDFGTKRHELYVSGANVTKTTSTRGDTVMRSETALLVTVVLVVLILVIPPATTISPATGVAQIGGLVLVSAIIAELGKVVARCRRVLCWAVGAKALEPAPDQPLAPLNPLLIL